MDGWNDGWNDAVVAACGWRWWGWGMSVALVVGTGVDEGHGHGERRRPGRGFRTQGRDADVVLHVGNITLDDRGQPGRKSNRAGRNGCGSPGAREENWSEGSPVREENGFSEKQLYQ